MLYLHCGLPRTSTTTLQSAFFEHTEQLAACGVVYPDRWRVNGSLTHHGLADLLKASQQSADGLDELERFLHGHADRDVLLSAEVLTFWLSSKHRQDALLGLLTMAREAMPVRCAWTLRRFDDLLESLYLLRVRENTKVIQDQSPAQFFSQPLAETLFGGMRRVEAVVDDVAYIEYDPGGAHNRRLLEAFEIPGPVAEAIWAELRRGPRRNAGLRHKQSVAMLRAEELSARVGAELDRDALRRAFDHGFEFERDRRCRLIGGAERRALHEQALAAARGQGFAPYVELFGGAEIADAPARPLDSRDIGDDDLARLVGRLAESPAPLSPA